LIPIYHFLSFAPPPVRLLQRENRFPSNKKEKEIARYQTEGLEGFPDLIRSLKTNLSARRELISFDNISRGMNEEQERKIAKFSNFRRPRRWPTLSSEML
jgi:hypothetical protein